MGALSEARDLEASTAKLATLAGEAARRAFLNQSQHLHSPQAVEQLCEAIPLLGRVSVEQAENVAQAARWLAELLNDEGCKAHSLRAAANVLFMRGHYREASEKYREALAHFERLGMEVEAGRTLSSSLQSLIYLGQYDQAFASAQKAQQIFRSHGDQERLARLQSNLGNILYRLDRFEEALETYQNAREELSRSGEPQAVAAILHNIAVCCTSLNKFPEALDAYQQARAHSELHKLPLLAAQADYNIAYLYYLRGDYTRAIDLYKTTREQFEKLDDTYHKALCDLDQSEIYLDLNLNEDASDLAERAYASFVEQGMGYEVGKALVLVAVASARRRKPFRALELFGKAREQFQREQNRVWPALIDLYQALVLDEEGRTCEARRLCESALGFFAQPFPVGLAGKAALSELLLARLDLKEGELASAEQKCIRALGRLESAEAPGLEYETHFILGQIQEAMGHRHAAYQSYREAHRKLGSVYGRLRGEELKIPFLQDKLAVYESLVWVGLEGANGLRNKEATFSYIEQAKSRHLADLISFRAHALPAPAGIRSELVEQLRNLREELNWYYRQIDLQEIREEQRSPEHIRRLRQRTRECEHQLVKTLGELQVTHREFAALLSGATVDLQAIRSALPAETMLMEYYYARETVCVCLLDGRQLEIVPLTPISRVRNLLRLLQGDLSRFRLGVEYTGAFAEKLRLAAEGHLRALYAELLAPLRERLRARHLVIVCHGFLHHLPFHALFDGKHYLVDECTVSYAPSASVYALYHARERRPHDTSMILGISDGFASPVVQEARAVASTVANPLLFLDESATEDCLREHGPRSRLVHIATHRFVRRDNPMFSSIQLGDSRLSVFDLYSLNLSAEIVTLSGCGAGLNFAAGEDESPGLVRGLLHAGAQAVLLTLWDVNGASTAEFMKLFYQGLRTNPNKAVVLQQTMQQLRQIYPHPYYWAPFALSGKTM